MRHIEAGLQPLHFVTGRQADKLEPSQAAVWDGYFVQGVQPFGLSICEIAQGTFRQPLSII